VTAGGALHYNAAVRLLVPVLLAALAAACTQSPTGPSAAAPASRLGAVSEQGGTPPPMAGDTFCGGAGQPTCPGVGATRFMAFGDSLTWGVPSAFDALDILYVPPEPADSYPRQLTSLLRAAYPVQQAAFAMVNAGWPGELVTQPGTRTRFQQAMATYRPQAVLLLEGINDLNNGVSISATISGLSQLIDIARTYNATVLVATMFQTCRSESPTGLVRENSAGAIPAFNAAVTSMATGRLNVHVVNLYDVLGTNNCTPTGGSGALGNDGLHPNGSGYALIANTFRQRIGQVFVVRGAVQ
jgi:lysophospholipase L1-like esterase